jgi:hypothetical protein
MALDSSSNLLEGKQRSVHGYDPEIYLCARLGLEEQLKYLYSYASMVGQMHRTHRFCYLPLGWSTSKYEPWQTKYGT